MVFSAGNQLKLHTGSDTRLGLENEWRLKVEKIGTVLAQTGSSIKKAV